VDYWQSKRIRLRAPVPQDLEFVFALHHDVERARFLGRLEPPPSKAELAEWLERQATRRFEGEAGLWVIDNGDPVGLVSTHSCQPRTGTFGHAVEVLATQRRRGAALDALVLVLRYYFDELRYQKSTVPVHADNMASLRLHDRLGYREEGRLRRMLFTGGRLVDEVWLGITDDEFRASAARDHFAV
jgi:RimJ/RimL family protein N-acetyltransferase